MLLLPIFSPGRLGYLLTANNTFSFIAYRALPYLNLKHTLFGRVIDDPTPSSTTMNKLETHPVNQSTNRPEPEIRIKEVTIFVDPFEEFLTKKHRDEQRAKDKAAGLIEEEVDPQRVDDDRLTWTGKRVRGAGTAASGEDSGGGGVGKYLKAALAERAGQDEDEIVDVVDEEPEPEPVRKKVKGTGGFGDFSSW